MRQAIFRLFELTFQTNAAPFQNQVNFHCVVSDVMQRVTERFL